MGLPQCLRWVWILTQQLPRTLSMTFGRPPAIPDSYVQLDLPVVDSVGEGEPFVDDKTIRHSIQFFNSTMSVAAPLPAPQQTLPQFDCKDWTDPDQNPLQTNG